jgi:glycosidase
MTRAEYQKKSRDNARTPMQWNSESNGGFTSTSAKPWMKVNPSCERINTDSQVDDPASTFNYWSSMLAARKKYKEILVYGNFQLLDRADEKILAYERQADTGEKILVLCNFSPDKVQWKGDIGEVQEVVLSNFGRTASDFKGGRVTLSAYESCAVLL